MSKKQLNKEWLWLFLGLWLTVFQSVATVHAVKHALSDTEHQCELCHHANHNAASPTAIPTLFGITIREQRQIVADTRPPKAITLTSWQARAPPFYS